MQRELGWKDEYKYQGGMMGENRIKTKTTTSTTATATTTTTKINFADHEPSHSYFP